MKQEELDVSTEACFYCRKPLPEPEFASILDGERVCESCYVKSEYGFID
jgi:hypothetical protein